MIVGMCRFPGLVLPFTMGLFLVAFFACTAQHQPIQLVSPQISSPNNAFIVVRDLDTTWNALARALDGSKERTVQKKDKKTGKITLKPVSVSLEANCDCGSLGDIPLRGKAWRHTVVGLNKRAPQETLLKIVCDYSTIHQWKGLDGKVVRKENIPCISNGRFERELHQRILSFMSP